MSERFEKLAEELASFPKPTYDPPHGLLATPKAVALQQLKLLGGVLGKLPDTRSPEIERMLTDAQDHSSILGETDGAVIIFRKMLAIKMARLQGKPEPTESDLQKYEARKPWWRFW